MCACFCFWRQIRNTISTASATCPAACTKRCLATVGPHRVLNTGVLNCPTDICTSENKRPAPAERRKHYFNSSRHQLPAPAERRKNRLDPKPSKPAPAEQRQPFPPQRSDGRWFLLQMCTPPQRSDGSTCIDSFPPQRSDGSGFLIRMCPPPQRSAGSTQICRFLAPAERLKTSHPSGVTEESKFKIRLNAMGAPRPTGATGARNL